MPREYREGTPSDALFELDAPAAPSQVVDARYFLMRDLQVLEGIGPVASAQLASKGVHDWYGLLENPRAIPAGRRAAVLSEAEWALAALEDEDVKHFTRRLPGREHWRIASAFPNRALFLDIETTGLSRHYHRLTVVGWVQRGVFHTTVGSPSKDQAKLLSDLIAASVLVTFNGAHFDLPFLRHHVPEIDSPLAHVDLRHLVRRIGLAGGQKQVENALGFDRSADLSELTGAAAPALWYKYLRGDQSALSTLIEYNHADVEGLRLILERVAGELEPRVTQPAAGSSLLEWQQRLDTTGGVLNLIPSKEPAGPRLKLSDLRAAMDVTVVGIDLSGGPKSITGWSSIRGSDSATKPMRTDEEIIEATLAARPDIVSIDAPLSLPSGRLRVDDDDPTRAKYGITRHSERELRRRGVNTYPALIRSMQGLTARGIHIAATLRDFGLPVIESFPGAMQDILGMPRKGLSLDALKISLQEYGLTGSYLQAPVTHDEIDALSSAIVGQLFWEGKFEALGDSSENYMIVPNIDAQMQEQHVVALSGPIAAGKTTLAELLAQRGYFRISYSDVLRRLFPNPAGPTDRPYLRELGARVHSERGQRWFSEQVAGLVDDNPRVVIDGVRYPADRALLVERFGRNLESVFISADVATRRSRYRARLDSVDAFEVADDAATERRVEELRRYSSRQFENTGGTRELKRFAAEVARTI